MLRESKHKKAGTRIPYKLRILLVPVSFDKFIVFLSKCTYETY